MSEENKSPEAAPEPTKPKRKTRAATAKEEAEAAGKPAPVKQVVQTPGGGDAVFDGERLIPKSGQILDPAKLEKAMHKVESGPVWLYNRHNFNMTIAYGGNVLLLPPRARKYRVDQVELLGNLPAGVYFTPIPEGKR